MSPVHQLSAISWVKFANFTISASHTMERIRRLNCGSVQNYNVTLSGVSSMSKYVSWKKNHFEKNRRTCIRRRNLDRDYMEWMIYWRAPFPHGDQNLSI